jgi:hypothetical protein
MTDWQNYYESNPRKTLKHKKKLVNGFGVNDLDYVTEIRHDGKSVYRCGFYHKWEGMIRRCYSKNQPIKHPSYSNVVISEDFRHASSFKEWMLSQVYKEKGKNLSLDKDLINPSAQIYSPENCVFVPDFVNYSVYTGAFVKTDDYPIGVQPFTLKDGIDVYHARSTCKKHLGVFSSPQLAHRAWQQSKIDRLHEVIRQYEVLDCFRDDVCDSLYRRIHLINEQIKNGERTYNLDF